MGLFTTAVVTGNDWGWTSPGVIACALGAVAAAAGFVHSSRRHPHPLVDRALLASRGFVVANVASGMAGIGFYAYLLTNVLWLQSIWGYGVLASGLALVPGAVLAAVTAAVLGPVAQRRGHLLVVVAGALVWAGAYVWYATSVGLQPSFLGEWLPGQVLSGIGAGATLPVLGSAALTAVPGGRYAVASAVNSSARQVGGVLGVALLVVLIGTPAPVDAPDALRRGWLFSAASFVACAAVAVLAAGRRGRADPHVDEGADRSAPPLLTVPEPSALTGAAAGLPPRSLVQALDASGRGLVGDTGERVDLSAGETLFEAGDPAGDAFSVLSGRVDVVTPDGRTRALGAGEVIGELAMITGGLRSAAVRAHRDSVLVRIPSARLDAALDSDPEVARSLVRVLAAQLASPPAHERQLGPQVVAVVGLHPGAAVEEVAAALDAVLSRWLRVGVSRGLDSVGLERMEVDHDRVLLTAEYDPDPGSWWARAVRQADVVVAVAAAAHLPDERVPQLAPGADVVLVGATVPDERVTDWSRRLDAWQVTRVPAATPAALRPLAARLAGRSLGLVMAGGGARAFAHLGVLAALEEADITVGRVAGCSVGGVVAALHAAGHSAADSREVMYAEFVRNRPFSDYTLPIVALAKGQRRRRALSRAFGDTAIEVMPRQFRCTSTDLLARQVVVHRTGPLVPALMATTALPGLFPPVELDGRLLVDGGVLSNLPVEALSERAEGPLVAVNISMGGGGSQRTSAPGGSRVDADGGPTNVTGPADAGAGRDPAADHAIGSGGAVADAQQAGAIVITPATTGVGLLEFHQFDELVAAGREAGRRLVEESGLPSLV